MGDPKEVARIPPIVRGHSLDHARRPERCRGVASDPCRCLPSPFESQSPIESADVSVAGIPVGMFGTNQPSAPPGFIGGVRPHWRALERNGMDLLCATPRAGAVRGAKIDRFL